MNKKLIILVILLLVAVVIIGILIDHHVKEKREICNAITGGSFNIFFETNGGEELSTISVGIGVDPDTYDDLPIPVREGFTFDGWYYDNEFKEKVMATNTIDISPVSEYDKHKCFTGFKPITLYAKWVKN